MRRAAKRDKNEGELVAMAERLGCAWLANGPLDGWIWNPRRAGWTPVEVKRAEKQGHADEYTPTQIKFFCWCKFRNIPWFVWRSIDDVIRDLGGRRAA